MNSEKLKILKQRRNASRHLAMHHRSNMRDVSAEHEWRRFDKLTAQIQTLEKRGVK